MTELLDPRFIDLPTPIPKQETPNLHRLVRLMILRLAGLLLPIRTKSTARTRLLLIRPDHVGDLLFLTPALRYLRTLMPKAQLTLMVGPWGEAVFKNNPHIDELILFDFPGFTRRPKGALWKPYRDLFQQARLLRKSQFDLAVILRFDHWWGAWLAAAAGIPRRFGYAVPEVIPFLTDPLTYQPQRHEVEQNWRLVHHAWSLGALTVIDDWSDAGIMGPLTFIVPSSAHQWAENWLRAQAISPAKPLLVIHPGAGAPVKLWRPEAWAALAQHLIDQYDCQIVLSGGPDEIDLCRRIARQISPSPPIAAGQTDLDQLAALLTRATLAVGPDTGALKLAAAVDTPTVELYGPVSPRKFGPWGDPAHQRYLTSGLACLPCNRLDYRAAELAKHFCVQGLAVDWVLYEVTDLLKRTWPPEPLSPT